MTFALFSAFRTDTTRAQLIQGGAAIPALADLTPLEPRMLMDATIGWELGSDGTAFEALGGLHLLFENQVDLAEQLGKALGDALAPVIERLAHFDLVPAAAQEIESRVEVIAERLRLAFTELRDSALEEYETLSGEAFGPEDVELEAIVAALNSWAESETGTIRISVRPTCVG